MALRTQGRTLRILAVAGGVLLVCATLLILVVTWNGSGAALSSVWVAPLAVGMLVALAALLLVERPSGPADDVPAATQCAACGRPIIVEWRLCPHCGELLECDLSIPTEGGSTRG